LVAAGSRQSACLASSLGPEDREVVAVGYRRAGEDREELWTPASVRVFAAAIRSGAMSIVTVNLPDFPRDVLSR